MSAAAGAQPPNQPPGGNLLTAAVRGKVKFNSWTKNTKIKTCKCTVCDGRVRVWSKKCDGCGRHVCSECLDKDSAKNDYYYRAANDRIDHGCWGCNWRSNMNPAFAKLKPLPEIRLEEERKAKESKALGILRKAAREELSSPKSDDEDVEPGDSGSEDSFDDSKDEQVEGFSLNANTAIPGKAQHSRMKRKRDAEEESDPDLFVRTDNSNIAKRKTQTKPSIKFRESHSKAGPTTMPPASQKSIERPEIHPPSDAPKHSLDASIAPHLEGGSSVIVGAGVVGLFVAYQLALEIHEEGIQHDVTVIEIRKGVGELASKHCAGVLSTAGMPHAWSHVAKEARAQWEELQKNKDFFYNVYQSKAKRFYVSETSPKNAEKAPTWFRGSTEHAFLEDVKSFGRVEPSVLSSWLYTQCKDLNVSFLFDHDVVRTEFTADSVLNSVYVKDEEGKSTGIPCQNLILTAGPFTTEIFDRLFNGSSAELENRIRSVHWFQVPAENATKEDRLSLQLIGAARDTKRLAGDLTMVVSSMDKTITVSAMSAKELKGNFEPGFALETRLGQTTDLRHVASKYLNGDGMDVTDSKAWPLQGVSRISTANGSRPVIDRVPSFALGVHNRGAELNIDGINTDGVFLCYGFGYHGTTLAPGAARMLVSKIFHGSDDVDNYGFSVPQ